MTSDSSPFQAAAKPFSKYAVLNQQAPAQEKGQNFLKSCAQVASFVAQPVAQTVPHAVPHISAGQSPIPQRKKNSRTRGLRADEEQFNLIDEKAEAHEMSPNAYILAMALGDDYVDKPSGWLREILLKIFVELSRQGNNLNQMTRSINRKETTAEAALSVADRQRQPVFRALEKLELALAGRRPPEDY